MIGMVIVAHGRLADEFLSVLQTLYGPQAQTATMSVGPDDDIDVKRQELLALTQKVNSGSGVVIVTDLFGGTPSNLAVSVMNEGKIEVLAGINLPCLVKLAALRETDQMSAAVRQAREAGVKYMNIASTLLEVV